MKNDHAPETPATRFLRQQRIPHSTHLYDYEPQGGTRVSARELNVAEHAVVKTLVMEDEAARLTGWLEGRRVFPVYPSPAMRQAR